MNAMLSADRPPEFHFETPPPFSYEEFSTTYYPKMLAIFDGPGGDSLRQLQGNEAEFLRRLLYLMTVEKLQRPDLGLPEMLYSINYGLVRYFLDQGHSPDAAREELTRVPWDFLPGMSDYSRETANAIAVRAFGDAVEGRPRSPLH